MDSQVEKRRSGSRFNSSPLIFLCLMLLGSASHGIAPPLAQAWESLPEYQGLTEDEESVLEAPSGLTSEYQSDIVSYSKPASWEYAWLSHRKAIDWSVGSLNASKFLMDNRMKLQGDLNDLLEFRLTVLDERNFDRLSMQIFLELVVHAPEQWKWIRLSFYGQPDHFKRRNDTGLALIFFPSERHEIRFFHTWIDVTRLRRSDRTDTFVEPDLPYSRGIAGRVWADPASGTEDFFEYALRYDTPTRWLFPDSGYEYQYWKAIGSLYGNKKITTDFSLSLRLQWDRKKEARTPLDSSLVPLGSVRTNRVLVRAQSVISRFGPRRDWDLTLGMELAHRRWEIQADQATDLDAIPHFELGMPAFGVGEAQDRWGIGASFGYHLAGGAESLFGLQDPRRAWETRMNLSYDFRFQKEKMVIRLVATADLDEYGSRKSWDGGNGQLSWVF